jgi:branched-chain amino acid transport system substrate-binding protein
MRVGLNARRIAAFSFALLIAAACSPPGGGEGSSEGPLKVGFIYPATGPFAAPGQFMREGFELALSQNDDQLGGREVEVVRADTKGDPNQTLTQARRLVEQEQVDFLFGPLTAAEGAALAPFLNRSEVAAIYPIVSTDDLTQRTISDYVARTGWSSSQTTHPFGQYAYDELGYRRVATIGFDFAFSWESVGGFVRTFQEAGGEVARELWAPIGTTDYSAYLSRIPRDVDAVFVSFSGAPAIQFINQYQQFGIEAPIIAQGNTTDESTLQETGPAAEGIVSTLHYSAALDSAENQDFVSAYEEEYGHVPSYYSEGTYTATLLIDAALESLDGDISEPADFVQEIESQSVDAPRGPIEFDEYGNPVENVYVREVEDVDGQLQNSVIDTFEGVSQFWNYDPDDFLGNPTYSRSFPECNAC